MLYPEHTFRRGLILLQRILSAYSKAADVVDKEMAFCIEIKRRYNWSTDNFVVIYICIWLNIIDIFVNIFFCSFEFPYRSNDIRRELVDKSSIISYFPSTFCPTFDHHQGRMYYKSDVTFGCTLLFFKNERLYCCIVSRLLFKFVSINSVSSKRHLSTLVLVSKLILLSLGCIFLICTTPRICSFSFLFCCSNIVVFDKNLPKFSCWAWILF